MCHCRVPRLLCAKNALVMSSPKSLELTPLLLGCRPCTGERERRASDLFSSSSSGANENNSRRAHINSGRPA